MIYSTCDKFPFKPEQDFFSIQLKIPEDMSIVPHSYTPKHCPKCKNLLLQEENICPICNPEAFYNVKDTTYFKFFQVTDKICDQRTPVLLFIFDLNNSQEDMNKVAHYIVDIISGNSLKSYVRVCFGFIGSSFQIYKQIAPGTMRFSGISSYEDVVRNAEFIDQCSETIFTAIGIASHAFVSCTDKEKDSQYQQIFRELDAEAVNGSFLSDVFLFTKGELPKGLSTGKNLKCHIFHLAEEPSIDNEMCALRMKATYYFSTNSGNGVFMELKNHITKHSAPLGAQIAIQVSNGIEIKKVCGPVSSFRSQSNAYSLEMDFFNNNIPFKAFLKLKKDKQILEKTDYFSIQIKARINTGVIFIINSVWKKAENMEELTKSEPNGFFKGTVFHSWLTKLLANNIKVPWNIPAVSLQLREMRSFKKIISAYEKLFTFIFSKNQVFDDNVLSYFLISVFYGTSDYFDKLFWAIEVQNLENNYIILPPLILINSSGKEELCDSDKEEMGSLTFFKVPDEKYSEIREKIETTRKKVNKYKQKI